MSDPIKDAEKAMERGRQLAAGIIAERDALRTEVERLRADLTKLRADASHVARTFREWYAGKPLPEMVLWLELSVEEATGAEEEA